MNQPNNQNRPLNQNQKPQNAPQNQGQSAPQNAQQSAENAGEKKEVGTPKLTTSEKYIRVGKLYEKLEKLDAQKAEIMEEIKQLRGR
ncbi:hypothetical protein [Helicobacter ailurogastricus]|uniref:hypothetical protein n=1 Tax=Helicobacter ailurogastricus TaxID=1578720 RepID=UPI000CF15824|nr:hypothetical protein [Helicobacter ailurogastricus]